MVSARCTQNVEEEFYQRKRDKSMFSFTAYFDKMTPPYSFIDMNVEFENCGVYSKYEITAKKGTLTAVHVKQKGTLADIFNGQIALNLSQPTDVKIELIVRSNDFPDGPITFVYCFSEYEISEMLDPWDL